MEYKFKLVLGDWSEDGHGKYEHIIINSNLSIKECQNAYKESCKKLGISFNDNEDFTETERDFGEAEKYQICTDYENSEIRPECLEILKKHECPIVDELDELDGSIYIDKDEFIKLLMWFIGLSTPEKFEWEKVEEDIPVLNGYWDENLNVQFGYGLYQ